MQVRAKNLERRLEVESVEEREDGDDSNLEGKEREKMSKLDNLCDGKIRHYTNQSNGAQPKVRKVHVSKSPSKVGASQNRDT